ncbi:uncharacterized protein [Ambystoma mexicanum]|uniref:uncharacterized protein n=1 Tax=Ambystoma mexicanum TaxID=8296 RepID=UPI0037E7F096
MATPHPFTDLQQDALCSICQEFYKDPVIIDCGHNFCCACLTKYMEQPDLTISCPECKQKFNKKNLKPNKRLANMVANIQRLEEKFGHLPEGSLCEELGEAGRPPEGSLCGEHGEAARLPEGSLCGEHGEAARLPEGSLCGEHGEAGRPPEGSLCGEHGEAGRLPEGSLCGEHGEAGRLPEGSLCGEHGEAGRPPEGSLCGEHGEAGCLPEGSLCGEHGEVLRLFCDTDETLICLVCRYSREHKEHSVRPIKEAHEDYKTAKSVTDKLIKELTEKSDPLKTKIALDIYTAKLISLEASLKEFKDTNLTKNIIKLKKDLQGFTHIKICPYVTEEYFTEESKQARQFKDTNLTKNIIKLKKDLQGFTHIKICPYVTEEYFTEESKQARQFKDTNLTKNIIKLKKDLQGFTHIKICPYVAEEYFTEESKQARQSCTFEQALLKKIGEFKRNIPFIHNNCTPKQLAALTDLANNTEITIKPADKGGAIVIQDTTEYNKMVQLLLNDDISYRILIADPTLAIQLLIASIIEEADPTCHCHNVLSDWLTPIKPPPCTRNQEVLLPSARTRRRCASIPRCDPQAAILSPCTIYTQDKLYSHMEHLQKELKDLQEWGEEESRKASELEGTIMKQREKILSTFDHLKQLLEKEKQQLLSRLEKEQEEKMKKIQGKLTRLEEQQSTHRSLITELERKLQQQDVDLLKDVKSVLSRCSEVKALKPQEDAPGMEMTLLRIRRHAQLLTELKETFPAEMDWRYVKSCEHLAKKKIFEYDWIKNCAACKTYKDFDSAVFALAVAVIDRLLAPCDWLVSEPGFSLAGEVTLDSGTAHPRLIVSADGRSVRRGPRAQDLPDTPQRFTKALCVLGREGLSSGGHYWEVEVGGCPGWTLGVCDESVPRKGLLPLSPARGLWTVRLWDGEYRACTSPRTPLIPRAPPGVLGLFLDYEAGRVSVYDAQDRALLFTFPGASFPRTLRPYFETWNPEGGLRILPGAGGD